MAALSFQFSKQGILLLCLLLGLLRGALADWEALYDDSAYDDDGQFIEEEDNEEYEDGPLISLRLLVEVTRHGQRAPEKIFDLTVDPDDNFKVPHNLTRAGAENHHATGQTLRSVLDSLDPDFLSEEYDPEEVYVQTTCHTRTIDSAVAQLEGLYSMPLQFPDWDDRFELNTMDCSEDFLLRMSKEMCPRYEQVRHAISQEIGTEIMYSEIDYDMERSGFYERLRQLTGHEGDSRHHMHLICDYIYWAVESNLELNFEMTDEEYNRCLITKERGVYSEFIAHEEITALPIYQMMQVLHEFSSIVKGELDWRDAEVFTQYIDLESRELFPKLVLYSTH